MTDRIPTSAIPGVTVLPFWQATFYTNNGLEEVRAIVWHFAQGGGTDSWLTRDDGKQGNNSCHIVVKYSGTIRQLVDFNDSSHSLHIDMSGTATDFGIFSLEAAQAALGAGWRNPNRYIVAIEVEGFEREGANTDQLATIPRLARYLEHLFPKAVHLGHRDFQDYKRCPGPTLFRGLLPHGGRITAGDNMDYDTHTDRLPWGGKYTIPANARVIGIKLGPTGVSETKVWEPRATTSTASYDAVVSTNKTRGNPFIRASDGFFEGWLISSGQVIEVPNPAPTPDTTDHTPFDQADLDEAVRLATDPLKVALELERRDDAEVVALLEAAASTLRS